MNEQTDMTDTKQFRKYKSYTSEQRAEIIAYVKENGMKDVREKYGVWPMSVQYWMDPSLREHMSEKGKKRHKTNKNKNPEYTKKRNQYRLHRKETGVDKVKYREWLSKLTPEQLEQRSKSIKQHRLDNLERAHKQINCLVRAEKNIAPISNTNSNVILENMCVKLLSMLPALVNNTISNGLVETIRV